MPAEPRRLGLTMRVATGPHGEARDALEHDWYACIAALESHCEIAPLPNLGGSIAAQLPGLGLSGVILTGGNSLAEAPIRDETERALLDYAIGRQLPVFGVCRGLQMLQSYFGGEIVDCDSDEHAGTRHPVDLSPELAAVATRDAVVVNSYHDQGVPLEGLAKGLRATASCGDWVEAVTHERFALCAVQWHPEREVELSPLDRHLMRTALGLES